MSTNHPHLNRANDAPPKEAIKPPTIFEKFLLDEALIQSKLYLRMKVTFLFSNFQSSLRLAQRSYHGTLMDYLSGKSIQRSKRATRWHNKEILLKGKW